MATLKYTYGTVLKTTASADTTINDIVVLTDTLGVAQNTADSGEELLVRIDGAFEMPKAAVELNAGEAVNWDASAEAVTNAAATGTGDLQGVGIVHEYAASGDTTCVVVLAGMARLT